MDRPVLLDRLFFLKIKKLAQWKRVFHFVKDHPYSKGEKEWYDNKIGEKKGGG